MQSHTIQAWSSILYMPVMYVGYKQSKPNLCLQTPHKSYMHSLHSKMS